MGLLAVGCDWWLKEKRDGGLLVWWNRKVSYIWYEGDGMLCIYGIWMLYNIGRIVGIQVSDRLDVCWGFSGD